MHRRKCRLCDKPKWTRRKQNSGWTCARCIRKLQNQRSMVRAFSK